MGTTNLTLTDQIMTLKNRIDELKEKKNKLEGRRQGLLDTLKKEHALNSFEDGQAHLKVLAGQITKEEKEVQDEITNFKTRYNI